MGTAARVRRWRYLGDDGEQVGAVDEGTAG